MTQFNGDCACAFTISTLIGTKRNFLIQMKMLWEDLLRRGNIPSYMDIMRTLSAYYRRKGHLFSIKFSIFFEKYRFPFL